MAVASILVGALIGFICGLIACLAFDASFMVGAALYFVGGLTPCAVLIIRAQLDETEHREVVKLPGQAI